MTLTHRRADDETRKPLVECPLAPPAPSTPKRIVDWNTVCRFAESARFSIRTSKTSVRPVPHWNRASRHPSRSELAHQECERHPRLQTHWSGRGGLFLAAVFAYREMRIAGRLTLLLEPISVLAIVLLCVTILAKVTKASIRKPWRHERLSSIRLCSDSTSVPNARQTREFGRSAISRAPSIHIFSRLLKM
jgi:hypothetical protein